MDRYWTILRGLQLEMEESGVCMLGTWLEISGDHTQDSAVTVSWGRGGWRWAPNMQLGVKPRAVKSVRISNRQTAPLFSTTQTSEAYQNSRAECSELGRGVRPKNDIKVLFFKWESRATTETVFSLSRSPSLITSFRTPNCNSELTCTTRKKKWGRPHKWMTLTVVLPGAGGFGDPLLGL